MARQNSRSKHQNNSQQNAPRVLALDSVLSVTDPGDDVQRRFRYQHAYGIILLAAAIAHKKPYVAILCEHHEDLVAQREDGNFDVYQIKTRQGGLWTLSDDALKSSVKRFVDLNQQFPGKINEYYFVSNSRYEESKARNKLGRNIVELLKAVEQIAAPNLLESPFNASFDSLCQYCQCEPLKLIVVLKKLKLATGPGLASFEDEIAQSHLAPLKECKNLPATALAVLRDELIAQIYKASSLSSNDPARHWYGINEADYRNPQLQAKKITIESVLAFIHTKYSAASVLSKDTQVLSEHLQETLNLYLAVSFKEDQIAKLDQAGETDPDRTTLLHQVFVDLELKPRKDQPHPPFPSHAQQRQLPLFAEEFEQRQRKFLADREKALSAMDCFLREISTKIVIIGGPGQGKSTLGQYLAQVHRAILLNCEKELYRDIVDGRTPQQYFRPETKRLPFRIVLKYFAQWLADNPRHKTVEAYIAEQICKKASRERKVNATAIHKLLKTQPTLFIFDGLDEVTEQNLCNQVLFCIEEFLARAEQLEANIQIIATSRPTSYKNQFTPNTFWHLELQPMSAKKINEYAANWINIKVPIEEEQRRVKQTLEGCLKEVHTRDLLTTPLQVTIILLVIKDRGRPPSQREALFQKYWSTILDREKSKAQGIIHTDDNLLFSLHAYLGYLLHKNAANKNTRSLFSADEFEQLVYNFLRSEDRHSSTEAIQQRVSQMVDEARTRLVLIVEPEKGFFGFEIRSLQEFFAGVYLVETASDTDQRFAHLKVIAYSQHWHNVALFVSGRIVNHYRGEAANILEMVCRPIDREYPDTYLRRGAWLALDIAADGVFGSYRNLQFSALEHALTVLSKGMIQQGPEHLKTALQRLSLEDRRDILSSLLKEKLTSVPLPWLPIVVDIYGQFVEVDQYFMQTLEILLSSEQQELIMEALNLGYHYKVKPAWLAIQLEKYWEIWSGGKEDFLLRNWWNEDSQYTRGVLLALSLSESQINKLMDDLLIPFSFYEYDINKYDLLSDPISFSEQIILLMQCLTIHDNYRATRINITELCLGRRLEIIQHNAERDDKKKKAFAKVLQLEVLDDLIRRSDLMPQLRVCLWSLYWLIYEPIDSRVEKFLNESRMWRGNQIVLEFSKSKLQYFRPLFGRILECQIQNDQNRIALLQPHISQEAAIAQQIGEVFAKNFSMLSTEKQLALILSGNYTVDNDFSELISITERLGMNLNELIDMYIYIIEVDGGFELSSAVLQQVFSHLEKDLFRSQESQSREWVWAVSTWKLNNKTVQQGIQLLNMLMERLPDQIGAVIIIFLKLLIFDATPLMLAPTILGYLADEAIQEDWQIIDDWFTIPAEHLTDLAKFTNHEDSKVRQGAMALMARFMMSVFTEPFDKNIPAKNTIPVFDWKIGFSLIKSTDIANKKKGILLLAHSFFPVTETKYFDVLCHILSKAQHMEEITAWTFFLKNFLVRDCDRASWQKLLETILANPQHYASGIWSATIRRYIELIDEVNPKIKDEVVLDIP